MYAGYPQYERAVATPKVKAPEVRDVPNAKFTAPYDACLCGPGIHCGGNYGWDAMNPDLYIAPDDFFSSSTDEIYAILSGRGVKNVIYMGVHTNMCVYGKPGALSHMWKAGMNCLLARDLNDAFTAYHPADHYTPDDGTAEIDNNLAQAGIPLVNMGDDFRRAGLISADTQMDFVRISPWGKADRPYFIDAPITVSLTAPFLDGTEIRYTTDGSAPTAQSTRYTAPFVVATTKTVRAAAFRKGKQVSLPSDAFFAKLPDAMPPLPDVYLDDLPFTINEYIRSVSDCAWFPGRRQSYEGKPLRIRGGTFARGMGCRAPSSMQFEVKEGYRRFVALAGVDENLISVNNGRFTAMHGSVVFKVYVDGQLAAESPVMRTTQEPWRFDVPLPAGSRTVSLAITNAGSNSPYDLANWINAGFVKE
jgi:hypothetical protein